MARKYKMTPRRRAALKKAQAASARKRRRRAVGNIVRGTGAVAGAIGSAYVAYHGQRYIANPHHAVREAKAAGKWTGKKVASATGLKRRAQVNAFRTHRATIKARPVKPKSAPKNWSKFGYL